MVETTSPAIILSTHTPASAFTRFTAKSIIPGKALTIDGTPIQTRKKKLMTTATNPVR